MEIFNRRIIFTNETGDPAFQDYIDRQRARHARYDFYFNSANEHTSGAPRREPPPQSRGNDTQGRSHVQADRHHGEPP
eukprot:4806849-Pyramimonas_sp.AAC.1